MAEMNIDERLEALTRRHESLAQHMELAQMAFDERMLAVAHAVELTELSLGKLSDETRRFEEFAKLVLANHEERMRRLES